MGIGNTLIETEPDLLLPNQAQPVHRSRASRIGVLIFITVLLGGIFYAGIHLSNDIASTEIVSHSSYVLLALALLIALGFEFVNGFHDTANAVATVIYTYSLPPEVAVVWSGIWNLIGVLASSGAVAFTIITLLPVDLILQVGHRIGFAMVFALLISAILWNLGTWFLGLPASSSHTMIGSIIGVGIASQIIAGKNGVSGLDWAQVMKVFKTLMISPVIGFTGAALLLLIFKLVLRDPQLYRAPEGTKPPPFWIRCLLILTCTGVSYAHGSNDGQKGLGLIMLILIGTAPTAYSLNHAIGVNQVQDYYAASEQAIHIFDNHSARQIFTGDARAEVTRYLQTQQWTPQTLPALRNLSAQIQAEVLLYKTLGNVPPTQQPNVRNQMYLAGEALRLEMRSNPAGFSTQEQTALQKFIDHLDRATKFIPTWVKVVVALALGLGTMVGWKRIVITVGEKIGKKHLNYAQGAAAQIVAYATILGAARFGLPVSTTHVFSSGIAGTMTSSGAGLQWSTIRSIAMAWVFTLPAAALLSGSLFWLLRNVIHM